MRQSNKKLSILAILLIIFAINLAAQKSFRVLVVGSLAKDHVKMMDSAQPFFDNLAKQLHFKVDFTKDTSVINDANLSKYQVFIMLHLAPFDMSPAQQASLQKFIESGKGWIGIHAAGLTGKQFHAGAPYWDWFQEFMGGIVYSPHPAFQKGTVIVEDRKHPTTQNLDEKFEISDEWYEFDKSPRPNVRVLAVADETSYKQNKPMGDHPIIWTNEKYPHTIYICVGHDPSVLTNKNYVQLLTDSILWTAGKKVKKKKSI